MYSTVRPPQCIEVGFEGEALRCAMEAMDEACRAREPRPSFVSGVVVREILPDRLLKNSPSSIDTPTMALTRNEEDREDWSEQYEKKGDY